MKKKTLIIVICAIIAVLGIGGGAIAIMNSNDNKHEHKYVTTVHPATCTEDGYTEKVCECGDKIKEIMDVAKGHEESEPVIEEVATCSKEGHGYVECTVCHKKIREVTLPKTAHLQTKKVRRAELNADIGNKITVLDETVCADCHAVISKEEYPVTFASKVFSYDGQTHWSEMTVAGLPDGYDYSLSGNEDDDKPGEYTVTATITFAEKPVSNGVLTTTYNIVKDGKYHDVLFDFEDGSGYEDYSIVVRDGDTIPSDKLPQVEERNGYNAFGGFDIHAAITKDESISMLYTPIPYAINYYLRLDGVRHINATQYDVETEVTLFDASTDDIAYNFDGWYTDESYATKVTKIERGTTGDQYFYAKWKLVDFAVNFFLNGGNVSHSDYPATYNVETGVALPYDPQKEHCSFDGWYEDEGFTKKAVLTPGGMKGDKNLYAKWVVATYTVSYELNGGNFNEGETPVTSYEYGSASVELSIPFKNGYTFGGWFTESTYVNKVTAIDTLSDGNKTYYAKWQAVVYRITYELNGGENAAENPSSYTIESSITLLPAEKTDYDFIGWYSENEFLTEITEIPSGSTGNLTLYAKFEIKTYSITYEGTKDADNLNPTSFIAVHETIILEDLSVPGYDFLGWYDGETKVTEIPESVKADVVLTAKWKVIVYTITYELFGGVNNDKNPSSYTIENDEYTFLPATQAHYDFLGWYSDSDQTHLIKGISKGLTGNLKIYARWALHDYRITYENTKDAENANSKDFTIKDDEIALLPLSKNGYIFEGWKLDGAVCATISPSIGKDLTLTATWSLVKYTIDYELNGGANDTENPLSYTIESEVITLKNPEKDSVVKVIGQTIKGDGRYEITKEITLYSFIGWYLEETFTTCIEVIETGSTGNLILYAKWETATTTTTVEQAYKIDGDYLYFGSYPQTDVTNEKSADLNEYAKFPFNTSNGWISYKYYSSGIVADLMVYKDVDVNNDGMYDYRGIYINSYRADNTEENGETYNYQKTNKYKKEEKIYWFKWEPIKWKIIDTNGAKANILADLVLDSQDYNHTRDVRNIKGETVYSNNYEHSSIRRWLNETFYEKAFTINEKNIINEAICNNGVESANPYDNSLGFNEGKNDYVCDNTNDKVWLLSTQEATRVSENIRRKTATDYAKSQGARIESGRCSWLLRSPCYVGQFSVQRVQQGGYIDEKYSYCFIAETCRGIVPALCITL